MAEFRVIGLTGGIASGKSVVARMMRDHGCPVIDADAIARVVVVAGQPALDEIRKAFGDGMVSADGRLDRRRLGELVFRDSEARRKLEAITHPRIIEEARRRIEDLKTRGEALAIWEAALLIESGAHQTLDGVIVVRVSKETQIQRLKTRDGLTDEEAELRWAAQLPLAEKVALATRVIDNDGPMEETRKQVDAIVADLNAGKL